MNSRSIPFCFFLVISIAVSSLVHAAKEDDKMKKASALLVTASPSSMPTAFPSDVPSATPTDVPSALPSAEPSKTPKKKKGSSRRRRQQRSVVEPEKPKLRGLYNYDDE